MIPRRIASFSSVFALTLVLGVGAVLPGAASAAAAAPAVCESSYKDLGFATQGACVSTLQTLVARGETQAVGFCKAIFGVTPVPLGMTFGTCVVLFERIGIK